LRQPNAFADDAADHARRQGFGLDQVDMKRKLARFEAIMQIGTLPPARSRSPDKQQIDI
jgi:hypothetical protein